MRRPLAYLLIFGGGGLFWAAARPSAPSHPRARAPFDPGVTENAVGFWEKRTQADPNGAIAAAKLAGAYLARFHEQGNETDLLRAESAAQLSLKRLPNRAALIALGGARLGLHNFAGAAEAATRLRAMDPTNLSAAYLLAEVAIERGQYYQAEKELLQATSQARNDPNGMTLRARLQEIHGKPDAALALYRQAVAKSDTFSELPAPTRAWFRSRVGACLAAQGKTQEAIVAYQDALDAFERDTRSRTALAQLALESGDPARAESELVQAEAQGQTQETALLRVRLLLSQGKTAEAKEALLALAQGRVVAHAHPRALALALADQRLLPEKAVALARSDCALRGDIYSHDTLAWALQAAGQKEEARREMDLALATGSRDTLLLRHAAAIRGSGK